LLQRQCACGNHTVAGGECAACAKKGEISLQRSALSDQPMNGVPPIVYDVLHESGDGLDASTRVFMEERFGHDFSGVRVYTNTRAAESAYAVAAKAYTIGQNVVFGQGRYAPSTSEGKRLFAHELAHVVQQSRRGVAQSAAIESDLERAADNAANSLVKGSGLVRVSGSAPVGLARDPISEDEKEKFRRLGWVGQINGSGKTGSSSGATENGPQDTTSLSHATPLAPGPKTQPRTLEQVIPASNVRPQHGPAKPIERSSAAKEPNYVPPAHRPKPNDPIRQVPIVQLGKFDYGTFGEATVIVSGLEGTQFAPDPSAGYNFDTYLRTPNGKTIAAKHLGGTRYVVFMGSRECPGCHFGRGITVDLNGEPFLLPIADALAVGSALGDVPVAAENLAQATAKGMKYLRPRVAAVAMRVGEGVEGALPTRTGGGGGILTERQSSLVQVEGAGAARIGSKAQANGGSKTIDVAKSATSGPSAGATQTPGPSSPVTAQPPTNQPSTPDPRADFFARGGKITRLPPGPAPKMGSEVSVGSGTKMPEGTHRVVTPRREETSSGAPSAASNSAVQPASTANPASVQTPGPRSSEHTTVIRSVVGASTERRGYERILLRGVEVNLVGWQRAHSQGAGTGVESPRGILYAPPEVNLKLQNQGVEETIRELYANKPANVTLHLITETTAHPGTNRLKQINYRLEASTPGKVNQIQFEAHISVSNDTQAPKITYGAE
ncbi:MAG: DUF4157 domain-containing protein, partial [Anaerolineae bacterium]